MATQTKTFTSYTIEDHPNPDNVYQLIRENWHDLYGWHNDNANSLKGFCDYFGVTLKDWEISLPWAGHSYVTIDAEHWQNEYYEEELTGVRLWKYLNNKGYLIVQKRKYDADLKKIVDTPKRVPIFGQCYFTGYMMDEALLDPIKKFMERPTQDMTMQDLMDACAENFISEYQADWESAYEDESIKNLCESNEYYFYENGELA